LERLKKEARGLEKTEIFIILTVFLAATVMALKLFKFVPAVMVSLAASIIADTLKEKIGF